MRKPEHPRLYEVTNEALDALGAAVGRLEVLKQLHRNYERCKEIAVAIETTKRSMLDMAEAWDHRNGP